MLRDYLELGVLGAIFLISIQQFFTYLKAKKNNGNGGFNRDILQELQSMNNNHLHELRNCIDEGNKQLINTIHSDNMKIIELLGEIRGITRK